MARHLKYQVASCMVHPIEQHQMAAGFGVLESMSPARVEFDGADGVGFAGVFRALLAMRPGRADAADEIKSGIETLGKLRRGLSVA